MKLSPDEEKWRHLGKPFACKLCKGAFCCQYNACTASPDDFDNDPCEMRNALLSGNYSIDALRSESSFKIEGPILAFNFEAIKRNSNTGLYIRARNAGKPLVDLIHMEDEAAGPCVMWSKDKGCALSYENRPKFGRTLVPMPWGECFDYYDEYTSHGLRSQIVREWKPYHDILMGMLYEFGEPGKIYRVGLGLVKII